MTAVARAIDVSGVSKRYSIGEVHTALLSERLERMLRRRRGVGSRPVREFWALRGVTFTVNEGEILGVIGRNGAGKSTLLKILSRITLPTAGRAELRGRVVSLLEVGTGFHPELTGRENVYLNGAILGMSRREIGSRFDEIVAFADVHRFIDTPVKHYSSGMYVRLAFAIAAHVEARILLIDEVLAVGDAEFQKRCLGKMGEVARSGRTVVFVSHNLTAIRNLCTHGLLLERGEVRSLGPMADVLASYASLGRSDVNAVSLTTAKSPADAGIVGIEVRCLEKKGDGRIRVGSPFQVVVRLWVPAPGGEFGAFVCCFNEEQLLVFSTGSFFTPSLSGLALEPGIHEFRCEVPGGLLNDGEYTLDVMLILNRHQVVASEPAALSFRVHDETPGVAGWQWRQAGVVRPNTFWSVRTVTHGTAGTTEER